MTDETQRKPVIIGLTGNIATGKSAVAQILAEKGALVIDADKVAHRVMEPGGPAYRGVVEAFGPGILAAEGAADGAAIDRRRLGDIVFADEDALQRLEAIVHPVVIVEVDRQIAEATEPAIVVEAIKLIEAGMHRRYDALWVVTAPRPVQIKRLVQSRGLTEKEAALRVDAQPPQEEKAARADRVIVNDGDLTDLQAQVDKAWAQLWAGPPVDGMPCWGAYV
jgi:dephospho-CoA kinase